MQDIDHLRRDFTVSLINAARHYRRTADSALASSSAGVSEACAAPLLWIGRLGGGVRQVTLAQSVGIEGPSLVRLLDQLVASGLVLRKDDPTDRRAKTVWLTDEGQRIAAQIESRLTALRSSVLAGVTPQDIETALRVLQAFYPPETRAQPAAKETETIP